MTLQKSRLRPGAGDAETNTIVPAVLGKIASARQGHSQNEHDHEHDHGHAHEHEHAFEWPEAVRIGIVIVAAAAVWFRVWEPFPAFSVIGGLAMAHPQGGLREPS
jgi:P-type Cu+ transporter